MIKNLAYCLLVASRICTLHKHKAQCNTLLQRRNEDEHTPICPASFYAPPNGTPDNVTDDTRGVFFRGADVVLSFDIRQELPPVTFFPRRCALFCYPSSIECSKDGAKEVGGRVFAAFAQ